MKIYEAKERFPEAYFLPDHDDAFVGMTQDISGEIFVCYDHRKLLKQIMKTDGCEYEDALEWIEYNIIGSGRVLVIE